MKTDAKKWNSRYETETEYGILEPDALLTSNPVLLKGGRAVDVACGTGANSIFLSSRGYEVVAVDISFVALRSLQREIRIRNLDIIPIVADLDHFSFPTNYYDLAAIFYFYNTSIISSVCDSLAPGGIIFCSTFNFRHTSLKPGFCKDYLVPRGGLYRYFKGFYPIVDDPEAGDAGNLSQFIGVKNT